MKPTALTQGNVTVESIMTRNVHCIKLEMTVHEAIGLLLEHSVAGAPIADQNGKAVSVVSEGDLLKLATAVGLKNKISDCLHRLVKTENLLTLKRTDTFAYAYMKALAHPVHRFIVIDGAGRIEGIVSRSNVLRIVFESQKTEF